MKTRIIHKLYNALRIQYSETVHGIPGFGTGSGTLEPVPWNRFLRQITIYNRLTRRKYCTKFMSVQSMQIGAYSV